MLYDYDTYTNTYCTKRTIIQTSTWLFYHIEIQYYRLNYKDVS